MITKLATLGPGGVWCDTSERLDAAQYKTIKALWYAGIIRTVAQSYQAPSVGMQASELEAALAAGIEVMLYQFARVSGWSATTGAADGTAAAKNALAIGYPKTACLWCDMEGAIPSAAAWVAYANAWFEAAVNAGMAASALGVYVAQYCPLTGSQLYHEPYFTRYWRAAEILPEPDPRGWQVMQLQPANVTIAPGIVIDRDYLCEDFLGSVPMVCAAQ